MSFNDTLTTPTATPIPFSQVPIQVILIYAVIAVVFISLLVLFLHHYYAGIGKKIVFTIYRTPDNRIQCRHFFHEIGLPASRREFDTVAEASEYIKSTLEKMFIE